MNKRAVSAVLGLLLILFAGFMAIPLLMAMRTSFSSPEILGLGVGEVACVAVGSGLYFGFRKFLKGTQMGIREGVAVTTLGWIVLTAFGALPFWVAYPDKLSFTDAFFEVMSGLTTTGSTIFTPAHFDHFQAHARGLLFWRSLTHWIGGMGIILLTVAILPLLGAGGYQLFRAEVPGPIKDRLKPRIVETAKTLWLIYVGLSAVETVLLMLCGMNLYDALCHTFGTMATGGFSTYGDSIAHFSTLGPGGLGPTRGLLAEAVIVAFMFLCGCNFVLLYHVVTKGSLKPLWASSEFRMYLIITACAILLLTAMLYIHHPTQETQAYAPAGEVEAYGAADAFRASAFNSVTILTTTGYGTENFDLWPPGCRVLLLILMMFGGCAGSTAGGMKMLRVILLGKFAWRELLKMIRPRAVIIVKHDGRPVDQDVLGGLLGFFILFCGTLAGGTVALTIMLQGRPPMPGSEGTGGTLSTAFTSSLAALSNIGPGLAGAGPARNFAEFPDLGKWLLSLLMLMGRLEIYTVVAMIAPNIWRK